MKTGNGIGLNVPEGRYTRSEAARLIGRSVDTLRRWHHQGTMCPSDHMQAGKLTVFLYTDKDIETLKHVAATQRPGRKPAPVPAVDA